MQLQRQQLIIASVTALVVLIFGFGLGRLTAGTTEVQADLETSTVGSNPDGTTTESSTVSADGGSTTSTIDATDGDPSAVLESSTAVDLGDAKVYGTEPQRDRFIRDVESAGIIGGTREGILATADHVCYTLERMQAQNRRASFAVRVVWNESLADMRTEDLGAFAFVFNAAPMYLCPENIEYGEDVAYWLGY